MKTKDLNQTATPVLWQVLTLTSALILISCEPRADQQALKASIEEVGAKWTQALQQGDLDAVAAMYTEDSYILPPNMPALQGRAGVKTYFSGALNAGIKSIRLVTEQVEGDNRTAIEMGTYAALVDGDVVVDQGKYLVHWKNRDGKWLFHRDIFNSDMPAPATVPLAKGNMLSLHLANVKLKPGVTSERFMEFYNTTVIPEFGKNWPDAKVFTAKAVRGQHKNNIGVFYYFGTEDVRDKYFNEDGTPTPVGLAMLEKMQPTFDRLEKEYGANNTADGTAYTDWIVQ